MSECRDCGRELQVSATRCGCGWVVPVAPRAQAFGKRLDAAASRAAYERVRPRIKEILAVEPWTRERFIAHWRGLLAKQDALPIIHQMAREALKNLGAPESQESVAEVDAELAALKERMREFERVPGEDDEALADASNP